MFLLAWLQLCCRMIVHDFWNLETIGVCDPIHVEDDDRALEKFNNTICYQEGQYFITWPWKQV